MSPLASGGPGSRSTGTFTWTPGGLLDPCRQGSGQLLFSWFIQIHPPFRASLHSFAPSSFLSPSPAFSSFIFHHFITGVKTGPFSSAPADARLPWPQAPANTGIVKAAEDVRASSNPTLGCTMLWRGLEIFNRRNQRGGGRRWQTCGGCVCVGGCPLSSSCCCRGSTRSHGGWWRPGARGSTTRQKPATGSLVAVVAVVAGGVNLQICLRSRAAALPGP